MSVGCVPSLRFRTTGRVALANLMALLALFLSSPTLPAAPMNEHVILLHGLCRSSSSMHAMERALTAAGYQVWNIDYPSRTNTVAGLSESVLAPAIRDCENAGATRIHFVGHSLGGILVRDYLARHSLSNAGRVVMLGPPNQGSEIVDKLGSWWLFRKINGPAGGELGTAPDSTPNRIGPPNVSVGVIAGNRSINWINSLLIPGSDDGKVSVERTKLAGMTDHIVLRATHPYLMKNKAAIKQTLHFLREGKFEHELAGANLNP
jgi:pimeloyl-ACP methyl ester carboxylesterase